LLVAGGTGVDGETRLEFIEKVETGWSGGVTARRRRVQCGVGRGNWRTICGRGGDRDVCGGIPIDGFGSNSRIQALVQGVATGTVLTTQAGTGTCSLRGVCERSVSDGSGVFIRGLMPPARGEAGTRWEAMC